MFNIIGKLFAIVLNKARSAVKGLMRMLLCPHKKLKVSNNYLHWKLRVKQMQRKRINVARILH